MDGRELGYPKFILQRVIDFKNYLIFGKSLIFHLKLSRGITPVIYPFDLPRQTTVGSAYLWVQW